MTLFGYAFNFVLFSFFGGVGHKNYEKLLWEGGLSGFRHKELQQASKRSYVKRPLLTGYKIFVCFSFCVCNFLLNIVRLQKYSTKNGQNVKKKVFNIKRVYKLSKDYLLIPFLLLL